MQLRYVRYLINSYEFNMSEVEKVRSAAHSKVFSYLVKAASLFNKELSQEFYIRQVSNYLSN